MKKLYRFTSLTLIAMIILSLTACSSNNTVRIDAPKYKEIVTQSIDSEEIARNDNFALSWDSENSGIVLQDIKTGKVWSAVKLKNSQQPSLSSDLIIDYVSQLDLNYKTAYSFDTATCLRSYKKMENSIEVTYCFTQAEITIPVVYTLCDYGVKINIDTNRIAEGKDSMLYRITILPGICCADKNSSDDYMFIPSGSGAICYPSSGLTRNYSEPVYGTDLSTTVGTLVTDRETIRMPVYGSKNGDTATFCIIEDSAESALIEAKVNDPKLDFSNCNAVFTVRGNEFVKKNAKGSALESKIYNEEIADTDISLRVYPLTGDNANYSGMANVYKNYIKQLRFQNH